MSRPVPNVSVIVSSPPPALTMLRFVSSNSPVVPGTGSWPLYVALPGSMTSFLAPALMVSEPGPVVIVSPPSCAAPAEPGGDETAETFVGRMRALRHTWEPVIALRLPSTPTTPVRSHVAANLAPPNSGVAGALLVATDPHPAPTSGRRRGRSRTGRRWRPHREADSRRPRSSCRRCSISWAPARAGPHLLPRCSRRLPPPEPPGALRSPPRATSLDQPYTGQPARAGEREPDRA